MTRDVYSPLLDVLQGLDSGEIFWRAKTWVDLAAYDAAPTVPEWVWDVVSADIGNTWAKAVLVSDNDYQTSDYTVFLLERGALVEGTEYLLQSGLYFVRSFVEKDSRAELEGSSYPDVKVSLAADGTYQEVIEAFCASIGKEAVFADPTAVWLGQQFQADGDVLVLNRAERFEQVLRQKFLILCHEPEPKKLHFYLPAEMQSEWSAALWADGQYVAVASSGAEELKYSSDGNVWESVDAPHYTKALCYSSALDLWVAVGDGVCMTSPDGAVWTSRAIGAGDWLGVAWNATAAKFVAVGPGRMAVSKDGITWTTTASMDGWTAQAGAPSYAWVSVCWSPELSMFAALSASGGTQQVHTSPDGLVWTARTTGTSATWNSICWSPDLQLFVAVGSSVCMTSPDGVVWTRRTPAALSPWNSVCWSPELLLFVAVGNGVCMTSPDGITWTSRTPPPASNFYGVVWAAELSLFVAVGNNDCMTSPDGVTWTARTPAAVNYWYGLAWSPELSLFVAVAGTGTNRVMTSPDGITWTARTPAVQYWRVVIWAAELGQFVALSQDGTNRVMTSYDGITWTLQAAATASQWRGLAWSPDLRMLLGLAETGQHMTNVALTLYGITGGGSQYVAVGYVGYPTIVGAVYTSSDASTWTRRTIPAGVYYAVGYKSGLYVAVGLSVCATSADGVTWTARTIPAKSWRSVIWASGLGLWVAGGNYSALVTSADGVTWTTRAVPVGGNWSAIAFDGGALLTRHLVILGSGGGAPMVWSDDGISWVEYSRDADYSMVYGQVSASAVVHGTASVHFIWRDEADVLHTYGDTDDPPWNLGYLHSSALPPGLVMDPFYRLWLLAAPPHLELVDGDRLHFTPRWTLDPALAADPYVRVVEHWDAGKNPSWWQEIESVMLFDGVEGGGLPASVERSGAYIPLASAGFAGNLDPSVTNVQALAEAVDRMTVGGSFDLPGAIHGAAAASLADADEVGFWRAASAGLAKITWANVKAALKTYFDALYSAIGHTHASYLTDASADGNYYGRRNGAWTNLKTYFDTLYSALGHTHSYAPTGSQYVTLATDATLSAERVLTAGVNLALTDGGAGAAVTLDVATQSATVTHNAAQTIGTGSWTTIAFNAEVSDPQSWHDTVTNNSRVYLPAGEYQVIIQNAGFVSNATGLRGVLVADSDGNTWGGNIVAALSGSYTPVNLVVQRTVSGTGKYIYCQVYQTSGGNLDLNAYIKFTVNRLK